MLKKFKVLLPYQTQIDIGRHKVNPSRQISYIFSEIGLIDERISVITLQKNAGEEARGLQVSN